MAKVAAKVTKPALYKMISYKGVKGAESRYTPLTAAQRLPKVEKSIGKGLTKVIEGLNSLGATLNSIASNTQSTLESWRDSIKEQISNNAALIKQEEKAEKEDKKREAKKEKQQKDQRKLKARDDKEAKLEKKKKKKKGSGLLSGVVGAAKKTGGGLLGNLGELLKTFITYQIFSWIAKNPKSVQKFAEILANIGKFVFKVIGVLTGLTLDGITDFLENPISLKGFFGIFKFLLGAVPLFGTFLFLKNPKLMIKTIGTVVKALLGGIKRLFGFAGKSDKLKALKLKKIAGKKGNFFSSKAGKIAIGLGVGLGAGMAVKAAGGTDGEALGAGAGAAGGQMLGAKLGEATGIPGMGAVGGMIGTMAGGAVGKAIGPMLDPIIEPVKKFFGEVQKIFNTVLSSIKDPLEEFFKTLGSFLSGILKVVEPHMPLIGKIISVGLQVMFAPLFLGIRALTAVMKLFTGGKDKGGEDLKGGDGGEEGDSGAVTPGGSGSEPSGKKEFKATLIAGMPVVGDKLNETQMAAIGMARSMDERNFQRMDPKIQEMYKSQLANKEVSEEVVKAPDNAGSFAKGGWINGPQSGYPVSLDGKRTSFIGHGKEWVGRKAGGKAFVVPFDTPATRTDRGLTAKRIGQAKQQGYSLPTAFDQMLRPYKAGGEIIKPKKKGNWLTRAINKTPQVRLAKWLGNKAKNVVTAKDKDGKPKGIMRWLAGAADQATGGFFDFDKQGHSMYQMSGVAQKAGQMIEDAKQKQQERKREKLKEQLQGTGSVVQLNQEMQGMGVGTGGATDNPIVVPGDHDLDADKYIQPKYGLVAEFLTDPVEFM